VEDNEMIKVSILVPICNVEKFLGKCLCSIVNQTLTDIEIICINDGSKDQSLEIIKKFVKDDQRIVVIDKPNSGYGDSMNKGMGIAKGEYIGIVESDDFINANMFDELYSLAKELACLYSFLNVFISANVANVSRKPIFNEAVLGSQLISTFLTALYIVSMPSVKSLTMYFGQTAITASSAKGSFE
jgi:glycosyltransferase involved in cell wall biosynthesis